MLRNGSGSKTVHHAKVGKAMGKAKEKERRGATVIAMPNLYATIGARAMGTADMPQLATFLTMDLGGEKRKRDNGSTSLPAKAMKRAKKEIMAMVIKGLKGEEDKPEKPKGSKADRASETLLALVRGEKRKKAASMIGIDLKKRQTVNVMS